MFEDNEYHTYSYYSADTEDTTIKVQRILNYVDDDITDVTIEVTNIPIISDIRIESEGDIIVSNATIDFQPHFEIDEVPNGYASLMLFYCICCIVTAIAFVILVFSIKKRLQRPLMKRKSRHKGARMWKAEQENISICNHSNSLYNSELIMDELKILEEKSHLDRDNLIQVLSIAVAVKDNVHRNREEIEDEAPSTSVNEEILQRIDDILLKFFTELATGTGIVEYDCERINYDYWIAADIRATVQPIRKEFEYRLQSYLSVDFHQIALRKLRDSLIMKDNYSMLFAIQLCIELCNRSKDSNYDLLRSQEYIQVQEFLDNEMRLVNELDCQQTAKNILLEERMIEQYRGICTEEVLQSVQLFSCGDESIKNLIENFNSFQVADFMSPIRNESKTKTSFALEDHQMGSSSKIEAAEEASVELIRKVVTCATAEFPKTPEQKGFAQCSAAVMSSQWKQEAYRSRREELAKLRERRDKRYDELQRRMDVARSEAKQFISQRRDQRTRMNLALQSINFQRSQLDTYNATWVDNRRVLLEQKYQKAVLHRRRWESVWFFFLSAAMWSIISCRTMYCSSQIWKMSDLIWHQIRLFCVHIDEYSDTGNHDGQSSSLVQLYSSKLGLDANLYTNWYEDRYRYLTEKSSFLSSAAVWYWSKLLYESKIIELWLPTDLCFCSFKVIRKFLVPGMTSLTLSYIPGIKHWAVEIGIVLFLRSIYSPLIVLLEPLRPFAAVLLFHGVLYAFLSYFDDKLSWKLAVRRGSSMLNVIIAKLGYHGVKSVDFRALLIFILYPIGLLLVTSSLVCQFASDTNFVTRFLL